MWRHLSKFDYSTLRLIDLIETHPDREVLKRQDLNASKINFVVVRLYKFPIDEVMEEQPSINPIYFVSAVGQTIKPILKRRSDHKLAVREYEKIVSRFSTKGEQTQ